MLINKTHKHMTKPTLAEVQAIFEGMTKGELHYNSYDMAASELAINYTFGAGINPVVVPDMVYFINLLASGYYIDPVEVGDYAAKLLSQAKLK